ncbi:MAG TPA: ABC transporter ATP-binding protein [Candidatus Binataceae bacterium]|nr:ABC transporter ATP-binding protein [Candidatus Binataceae bacterium]
MPELVVRKLSRRFSSGGGLGEVSLTVERGEFFVLLGPSGCGKSTMLRLIAGLDQADAGEIVIGDDGQDRRGAVAMVFQNYALYPHMTAFENIAFPLRLRRIARAEVAQRVASTAELAGLAIDLGRYPGELSGGERQRVALARALVREPRIVLLDEPLSNLDAQLRTALRLELKQFQRRTGRTFIYVTHDQVEALTLADRLAVMRAGNIEQIGTPAEVFRSPANQFVAGFVGQPPMNLMHARRSAGAGLEVAGRELALAPPPNSAEEIVLGLRPEDLGLEPAQGAVAFEVEIDTVEFSGARFLVSAHLGDTRLVFESPTALDPGERRLLYFLPAQAHFFDYRSGVRL